MISGAELDQLVKLAEGIAAAVVERLATVRPEQTSTKSTATDMVTEIDLWAERYIVGELVAARPHDAIVGEEGTRRPGTTGVEWYIDPIDGTTNYLYGHPGFSVSLGATVGGTASVGVVGDPTRGEIFTARRGGGAFCNGTPIRCRDTSDLRAALVATGFGYLPARRQAQAAVLARVLPEVRDMRRMGGAALDLCSVACGRVDAYYEYGIASWDVAAGAVIAAEAGAVVGDLDGRPSLGPFILAAAPQVAPALADLLRRTGAVLDG